ncbi:molybdopterin-dependent oxidoreductase [Nocardia sp. NPDC058058]|uniref:molybdopterin-dependent oxidoreductase n=1 Tax=Nocardia sp. NPDC058058 TaxID=3346317 RepID=UPI0036DCA73A
MTTVRRRAMYLLAAIAITAVPACSSTDSAAAPSTTPSSSTVPTAPIGGLTISGAVPHPVTLTADQLRGYPVQTQVVTFDSSKGKQSHTYQGAAVADLINDAHPVVDRAAKNPELRLALVASGSDGYQAVLAWAEFSRDFAAKPILIAYTEDGQSLPKPRLVVPGDIKGGRYVSDLTDLRIVDLGITPAK